MSVFSARFACAGARLLFLTARDRSSCGRYLCALDVDSSPAGKHNRTSVCGRVVCFPFSRDILECLALACAILCKHLEAVASSGIRALLIFSEVISCDPAHLS